MSFETAVLVFEDSNRLEFIERNEGGEERWHAIGSVRGSFFFMTVIYTYTDEDGEPSSGLFPPAAPRATKGNFMLKQFSEQELLGRPLSEAQKLELLGMMDKRDEDIDTSDIPEALTLPPGAVRGGFRRGCPVHLTGELHAYFPQLPHVKAFL